MSAIIIPFRPRYPEPHVERGGLLAAVVWGGIIGGTVGLCGYLLILAGSALLVWAS